MSCPPLTHRVSEGMRTCRHGCRAVDTLEPLELTAETEAQWHLLAKAAMDEGRLAVAERCYAALGDVARASYLHQASATPLSSAAALFVWGLWFLWQLMVQFVANACRFAPC